MTEYDVERLIGEQKAELDLARRQSEIQQENQRRISEAETALTSPSGLALEKAFFISPEEQKILKKYVGVLASNHVLQETLPYRTRQEEYRTLTLKKRTTPVNDTATGYRVWVAPSYTYDYGRTTRNDNYLLIVTTIFRLYSVGAAGVPGRFNGPYMVDFIAKDIAERSLSWPK